jgi:glycolate oxidase
VTELIRRRVVPAAIELIDGDSLRAVERFVGRSLAPPETGALVVIECDGTPAAVAEEIARVSEACHAVGATTIAQAATDEERESLWAARRELSPALKATGLRKINHDVVVPRGRIPDLFAVIEDLRRRYDLRIASFGHAGDGNIHVNLMIDPSDAAQLERAKAAERTLFERVVQLEGSISGEHGIGFAKAPYIGIELSRETLELMKRVKAAFDPHGILNPGKIFP